MYNWAFQILVNSNAFASSAWTHFCTNQGILLTLALHGIKTCFAFTKVHFDNSFLSWRYIRQDGHQNISQFFQLWLHRSTWEIADGSTSISHIWGGFGKSLYYKAAFVDGKLLQSCCFVYILHLTSVRLFMLPDLQNKRTIYFSKHVTVRSASSSVTPKSAMAGNTSSLAKKEKAWNPTSVLLFSGPKTSYTAPILFSWLPDSSKTKPVNWG